jgi:hypothetical protein
MQSIPPTDIRTASGDDAPSIRRCPVCNYRLEGLPPEHQCPECGSPYDRHTRVWKAKGFWRFAGPGVLVLVSVVLPLPVIFIVKGRPTPGHVDWLSLVMIFLMGLGVLWWVYAYRRGPLIAVTPAGLLVRRNLRLRIICWSGIKDVRIITGYGWRAELRMLGPLARNIVVNPFLRNRADAEEFREAIRSGKERYVPEGDGEDGGGSNGDRRHPRHE